MTYLDTHKALKAKLQSADKEFLASIDKINVELLSTSSIVNLTDKIITEVSKGPVHKEDFQALLVGLISLGVLLDKERQGADNFEKFMATLDAAETNE